MAVCTFYYICYVKLCEFRVGGGQLWFRINTFTGCNIVISTPQKFDKLWDAFLNKFNYFNNLHDIYGEGCVIVPNIYISVSMWMLGILSSFAKCSGYFVYKALDLSQQACWFVLVFQPGITPRAWEEVNCSSQHTWRTIEYDVCDLAIQTSTTNQSCCNGCLSKFRQIKSNQIIYLATYTYTYNTAIKVLCWYILLFIWITALSMNILHRRCLAYRPSSNNAQIMCTKVAKTTLFLLLILTRYQQYLSIRLLQISTIYIMLSSPDINNIYHFVFSPDINNIYHFVFSRYQLCILCSPDINNIYHFVFSRYQLYILCRLLQMSTIFIILSSPDINYIYHFVFSRCQQYLSFRLLQISTIYIMLSSPDINYIYYVVFSRCPVCGLSWIRTSRWALTRWTRYNALLMTRINDSRRRCSRPRRSTAGK